MYFRPGTREVIPLSPIADHHYCRFHYHQTRRPGSKPNEEHRIYNGPGVLKCNNQTTVAYISLDKSYMDTLYKNRFDYEIHLVLPDSITTVECYRKGKLIIKAKRQGNQITVTKHHPDRWDW